MMWGTGKNTPWVKPWSTRRAKSIFKSFVKQKSRAFTAYRPAPSTSIFLRPTRSNSGAAMMRVNIPTTVKPVIIMPVMALVPPKSSTYTGKRVIKVLLV